jgi:hypothetical protein
MLEQFTYRLPDGYKFNYAIDSDIGITINDIDRLVCLYYEHTFNLPETVFIRENLFYKYMANTLMSSRYSGTFGTSSYNTMSIWSSVGQVPIKTTTAADIPLLVGTQKDYDDNNINWLFEEIVLANCERE